MTRPKERPIRVAQTNEENKELMQAIVKTFNGIYSEINNIEEDLRSLLDRVRVIREKVRRVDEYRSTLECNNR